MYCLATAFDNTSGTMAFWYAENPGTYPISPTTSPCPAACASNEVALADFSAASLASKIKDIATRNKVTTVTKDKPTLKAIKEALDKRIAMVFLKYKEKSFPMDYKPGSMFAKFVTDLQKSGAFNSEDEVSDFMSSDEFDNYANKFNVDILEPVDNDLLSVAPKEPVSAQDMIPSRAPQDFISADLPHRVSDLMEKLKKTGKLTKSELKEIIKHTK